MTQAVSRLFDVTGRHVLVTGGSRGIGAMIVRGLHDAGATVYVAARNAAACHALAGELGDRAVAIPADVSTSDGCAALAAALAAHTDRLHVLVNNAASLWDPSGTPLEEYPDQAWDALLGLNLKSPFQLMVACLPMLRAAATATRPANVINISSLDGRRVARLETYAYGASKAGLEQLTRRLATRLAAEHITVNAIAPGLFPSEMTNFALLDDPEELIRTSTPLGRAGGQDDIAGATIFLSSRSGAWVTGAVLPVDGGAVLC